MKAGDRVIYVPHHAHGNPQHPACESGMIVRIEGAIAFVRYDEQTQIKATAVEHLRYELEQPRRFRKLPVTVEAWQFKPGAPLPHYPEWIDERWCAVQHDSQYSKDGSNRLDRVVRDVLLIPTPEGVMTAMPGDWIIRGVNGEVYPCKPDIFAKTYEADV